MVREIMHHADTSTRPARLGSQYPTDAINQFVLNGHWGWGWARTAVSWGYKHRRSIAHHAVGMAATFGAVALGAFVCAGTAGIGCVLVAGALYGAAFNVGGQYATSRAFHDRIRKRSHASWAAQGAFAGVTGGYGKYLPKRRFRMPSKIKIAVHHYPDFRRFFRRFW